MVASRTLVRGLVFLVLVVCDTSCYAGCANAGSLPLAVVMQLVSALLAKRLVLVVLQMSKASAARPKAN